MGASWYGSVDIRILRNPLLDIATMFGRIGVWRARSSDNRFIWLHDLTKFSACLALCLSDIMIVDVAACSY